MPGLGELEASVMDVLWDATEPMRVRQVLDALNRHRGHQQKLVVPTLDAAASSANHQGSPLSTST
ncbi:BlaI/MecI/CopY family transcriptional regulator [Amycolatopsis sp. NPDC101161]|uniref:BlaI/MecI/CopY family transcriptional regulator n=1 Tax=Amycolatopsis sp. NPDC101161 TaxID=3363940 RepID=UPI00380025AC